ncbi:MAG: suppressor of fused domain protein [Myxococcales bacterium]|nr:suppressor of fused domain protein [Myxococcales bacterium]
MIGPGYARAIVEHYATAWSAQVQRLPSGEGPVHQLGPEFGIVECGRALGVRAFATVCMSQPGDASRVELHLLTREPGDSVAARMAELLTAVAHYHRTGNLLGLGHTVNFGEPWLPGSRCTHGLISLPYLDGPKLEWLDAQDVRCLWLIPIAKEELAFKRSYGLEALEVRFEETSFDYLDPLRAPVV